MEWADKYIDSYDTMTKAANYYLNLSGDKNIVYDNLHTNEKNSYYNFLPEKLCVISRVHPQDWCSGCESHVDDCSELLKRINKIFE
jgi:hypothetical protein